MESVAAYLDRKYEELTLLNGCLKQPVPLARPQSPAEIIRNKFQLTAALKAEHALEDWTVTETAWAHQGRRRCGPFEFTYDYQRADLGVRGPSFYDLGEAIACQTIFTISGMAAIAALVFAVARLVEQASLVIPSGCYGETKELVEGYARHLRLISAAQDPAGATARAASPRMLLLDSSAPAFDFNLSRDAMSSALDLIIFDTTCLSAGSRRIRRVLDLARRCKVPVAMVRSHTKLDSLGAEYGRLGSVTFVDWDKQGARSKLKELPPATTDAVRLIGGAAIPAHFPPYVGTRAYRRLTNRRMAAILRNCRRASRYFAASLPGLTAELHFTHNLYITLKSARPLDEAAARAISTRIVDDLAQSGLPIRHAGSFGFDFAASEWFCDSTTGQYHVRIAVPDLATPHWDELTRAIAGWWKAHQRETAGA